VPNNRADRTGRIGRISSVYASLSPRVLSYGRAAISAPTSTRPTCTQDDEGESGPGESPGQGQGEGSPGGPDSGVAPVGGSAAATSGALPDITIKLKAKRLVATAGKPAKVTLRFGSNVTGATFRCRVDAKPFKPCPATFTTRPQPGKHRITTVAVTAAGADPTPATVEVTVVRKAG